IQPLLLLCVARWIFSVNVLAAALWIVPCAAQQPTFRTGTRLIVQTVSVKDKDGKPIEGLTARDFVVTEDNEPQTVSFVEFQRLEDTAPATSPATAVTLPDSAAVARTLPAPPLTPTRPPTSPPRAIPHP